MMPSYQLGFLALVDAVALLALGDRFRHVRGRWLLVAASTLPVAGIVVISALVNPFAITRYTAVAAPFMLVSVAVVAWRVPRTLGVGLIGVALLASVIGTVGAQMSGGQWPDTRAATADVGAAARPGDLVAGVTNLQFFNANAYYDARNGITTRGFASTQAALASPDAQRALDGGGRVFLLSWPPVPGLRQTVADAGARVRTTREYGGTYHVQVAEVVR